MKYRALRGVCIGSGRHLLPGDQAELDGATAQFLSSIGAVEEVAEAAAPAIVSAPAEVEAPKPFVKDAKASKKGI